MASRRQEKLASVIRGAVSAVLMRGLSDPRVSGVISVTEVDVSPDAKTATVYVSIMGKTPAAEKTAFAGIQHAAGYIQAEVADQVHMRKCPQLHFKVDDKIKKTMETIRLINEVTKAGGEEPSDTPANDAAGGGQVVE